MRQCKSKTSLNYVLCQPCTWLVIKVSPASNVVQCFLLQPFQFFNVLCLQAQTIQSSSLSFEQVKALPCIKHCLLCHHSNKGRGDVMSREEGSGVEDGICWPLAVFSTLLARTSHMKSGVLPFTSPTFPVKSQSLVSFVHKL